ncbi:MAG TPA: hypothetical protein DCW88_22235 [Agrobacterium sp.]|jgi:hypothetical protein|uniref:hypothetical protein n=1 Tax=Rhizobium/Agrobacterium group TaxID=227290 RepID=UPI000E8903D1|nr:hypothetical protein [Agrobacterium tumefaciens]TQN61116.1 hypothetical protein FLX27_13060 [Agrobacterium tumefaciens]HAU78133.1 hypothetical protein [Agrobacterium sp.]HCD84136.1 hypothetical protein [Agrobacterium sp.]
MMNGLLRRRRASLGIARASAIETMDRKTLLGEAIRRCPEIEPILGTDWVVDDQTCRRAGWLLVEHTGTLFHLGRRLLELSAPGGALLPPLEFRLCRQIEPSAAELISAPLLDPWSLVLFQSGHRPACWKLGGIVHHPDHHQLWVTTRLLYLHREKQMAHTEEGWVRLGQRMPA